MKNKKLLIQNIIGIILLLGIVILEFWGHRKVYFCADDLWYATNIVTGEKLSGIGDVFASQYWHYFNWGGRSITHGILQLTLMSGELCADILNVIVSLILSAIICAYAKSKNMLTFTAVHAAVLAFNPIAYLNMFWQAGAANYLYSTTWILITLIFYIRQFEGKKYKNAYMIPLMLILGLMTGWSNENMGPGAMCIVLGITIYLTVKNGKQPAWMWVGSFSSIIGAILVIIAPGNFVRGSLVEENLIEKFSNHFVNLSRASMEFIFAAIIVTSFCVTVYSLDNKISKEHMAIGLYAILAQGAMFLSPMYPARASFGVMVLLILLSTMILVELYRKSSLSGKITTYVLLGFIYVAAIINTVSVIKYTVE